MSQEPRHRRPSDSHHAGIGELVEGRYRIRGVLGRGAWSVVYDATSARTGQPVALKMLLRGLPCGDERAEERFFREAKVTAALQHPHTLRVFDVGRTRGGALYLASEQLCGPTLEEVIAEREKAGGWMTPLEMAEILDGVLGSLAEAHDRGLVHRDIKAGNIMLHSVAGERFVKVLDFGIAMLAGARITARGVSLGTPDAMSPEQCAHQELDGRSDLYAVAALTFRALAGRPVFVGEDVYDVMRQHREAPPPALEAMAAQPIPKAFAEWVARGLAKHPKDRFDDARAMRVALRAAAASADAVAADEADARRHANAGAHSRAISASDGGDDAALGQGVVHVRRHASSSRIPVASGEIVASQTTGEWRVGRREWVGPPEQVLSDDEPRPRSTSKYAQVSAAALGAHRARGPALEAATPAQAPAPPPATETEHEERKARSVAELWAGFWGGRGKRKPKRGLHTG